jgi:hypothetical protein
MATTRNLVPPQPAQTTELEFITPAIAEQYITGNCHNRNLMQGIVEKYARIIKMNMWKVTHQGVCFDFHETLIDGQHRLYAIWLVGQEDNTFKGVWMNVTRNADPESMDAIDIGKTRLPHDVILLAHPELASLNFGKLHVAIARAMAGGLAGRNKALKTIPEQEAFIKQHIDAIQFAQTIFPKAAKGISAGLKAVIGRAFYHVNHDLLRKFANVLSTGFYDVGEEAAIVLREAVRDSTFSRNSDAACQLVYARTERALDAFVNNRPLRRTPTPVQEELYPLAEEVSAAKAAKEAEREAKRQERAKNSVAKLKKEATTQKAQKENVNRPLITNRRTMAAAAKSTQSTVGGQPVRRVIVVKRGSLKQG